MTTMNAATKTTPANGQQRLRSVAPAAAPAMTTRVELVTPAMAAEWLKSNTRNRNLISSKVDQLATIIASGLWRTTHQGIAFGEGEVLYDGQHRLHAIIKAGVPVRVAVTRGLLAPTLEAIDLGNARKVEDVMAFAGGPRITHNFRAAVMACAQLVAIGSINGSKCTASIHTLRAAMDEHGPDVAAVEPARSRFYNSSLVSAFAIARRTAPAKTAEFIALFHSGDGIGVGHPAYVLREYFLTRHTSGAKNNREALSQRAFAALDAFVEGRMLVKSLPNSRSRAKFLRPWREDSATTG
jgi:hypothetical protein